MRCVEGVHGVVPILGGVATEVGVPGGAEAAAIAQSLECSGWNRKAAANDLQISYKALLYKIKQYNLTPPPKQYGSNRTQTV